MISILTTRRRNYTKHEDIINDLLKKKNESIEKYKFLFKHINNIYLCEEDTDQSVDLHFDIGYPVDMLLKTIKWMFIEQDVRYWNYSSRGMLGRIIPTI